MTGDIAIEGGGLVVSPDKEKMLRRLNTRAAFILLPVAVAIFLLFAFLRRLMPPPIPPAISTEFTALPWCVVVFYFVAYVAAMAAIQRQNRPIVTLSPQGLTIHTVATQIGMLRWEEIGEVRTYTFIYRYVGIVPRDPKGLYHRLGSRSLPLSADDLAARIRDHRSPGSPRPAEAGVWPPPPTGEGGRLEP